NTGEMVGESFHIGPFTESSNWFHSSGRSFITHSFSENLRHLRLTQTVSQSSGRTAWALGGGWSSNRLSLNVDHSVPSVLGRGYEQVLGMSVSFRLHDVAVTAATVTNIFGSTRWTVYGTDYVQTGLTMGSGGSGATVKGLELRGQVVDDRGQPVEG